MRDWLLPIALLVAPPVCAQDAEQSSVDASSIEISAIASAAVELSTQWGMKTVAYGELDDQRTDGRSIIGFTAIGLQTDTNRLVMYLPEHTRPMMDLFQTAAEASGGRLRSILVVVDQGQASIITGHRMGPIEGYNARLHAEVDRAFPGYP